MAVTIDWGQRIIQVPQSFLDPLGGANYQLDTNAFHLALRDLEDDEAGAVFPPTHNHNTTVLLGGIEYARIIEIINGYTVTFEAVGDPYKVFLSGSNNNILDVTNLNNVSVASSNSAGLVQMQEIQFASFDGGVWLDVVNGTAGTLYPSGTRRQPCASLADAMQILTVYGFGTIYVVGDAVIDSGGDYTGVVFVGESKNKTTLTISDQANVYRCEFVDAHVTGTLDGDCVLKGCLIDDLNYISGFVEQCVLAPGVITLGGSSTAHFLDCYSGVPGLGTPTIDCGGDGPALALRNYNGGISLTNKSGSSNVSIDLNSGQVLLDSTVTAGQIVVRGMGKLTDNSQGATVIHENLLDLPEMVDQVWAQPLEGSMAVDQALRVILAALSGRTSGIGTTTENYKSVDGAKNRITATFDENGNRQTVNLDGAA